MDNPLSYTSAESLPIKLLYHPEIQQFSPIHIQWIPTNVCNLNCRCCSCRERDKTQQMNIDTAMKVIEDFAALGTKAVTITGGGEPLIYPHIQRIIDKFFDCGIKIGLVTNGLLLNKLSRDTLRKLIWCRVSSMDERDFGNGISRKLAKVVTSPVDWAFSHVVTASPNLYSIKRLVDFANRHHFTHVRLVADLLETEKVDGTFKTVRNYLNGIDDLVIYQLRNNPKPCKSCLLGYIKPLIGPDFKVYYCCGVQYALEKKSLDLPEELSMGSALDLDSIYQTNSPCLVNCKTCYYTEYNYILSLLQKGLVHKEFI